jgi:hypothetical protein
MCEDEDDWESWDEETELASPPDIGALDPEDDDEAEPEPGDFWLENDDAGDD